MGITAAFFIIVPMLALIVFANIMHHLSKSPEVSPSPKLDLFELARFNDIYSPSLYHSNNRHDN